jgi:hypothetical protein
MRLPRNNTTELIRELALRANQSQDNSFFSLLLGLEEQIRGDSTDQEVLNQRGAVNRRRPILFTYPRSIE